MRIFGKEVRDKYGRMVDSPLQWIKKWWLGRKLRNGKVPRGRTISPMEAADALAVGAPANAIEGFGILSARVIRGSGVTDLGVISVQKITVAFRDRLVDSLQNSTTAPLDVFKYHATGTGTTAEANTDTALVTEVGARVSGTQTESAANIYRSVATVTPGGTYAITEHGLLSAAAAGVLMDRSVFAAINITAADSIQFTYDATFNAEA
ncbi:MAG: hypothetical protein A2Y38_16175 [Spirochaetes bacterium GWB1_59_5]|nr:MAG: hypothetical protein A2Y38_16175 [Spirochaetes bacterium GWB1_59_5]